VGVSLWRMHFGGRGRFHWEEYRVCCYYKGGLLLE
jgi:hypothetical protein